MNPDSGRVSEFIMESVSSSNRRPQYYAPVGSHLYGYSNNLSDVDIVGFHTVPSDEYSYLFEPDEVVEFESEENSDLSVEVTSYELRRFAELLIETDCKVVESVVCSEPVIQQDEESIMDLNGILMSHLPSSLPHTYRGMAKSNYHSNLDRDSQSYEPLPKNFLHVLRELMSAIHLVNTGELRVDINYLSENVEEFDERVVDNLVKARGNRIDGELEQTAHDYIEQFFADLNLPSYEDKSAFKMDVDSWMRSFRN